MSNNLILPTMQANVRASEAVAVTLYNKDNRWQIFNPSVGIDCVLDSVGIKAGEVFRLENRSANKITVKASNGSELSRANGCNVLASISTGSCILSPLQDAPTLPSHWLVVSVEEGGNFTPTRTPGTNIAAMTHVNGSYVRIGNIVHVHGANNVDPTSASVLSNFTLSLPVAKVSTTYFFGIGNSGVLWTTANSGSSAFFSGTPTSNANQTFVYSYTYQVEN